jgi:hypothetical protein
MAFTEAERAENLASLKWFVERHRPPEHLRSQVDIGYSIVGHTVEVFEIRPEWRDASSTRHLPFARVRFFRSREEWKLYWRRSDLKWYGYEPSEFHKSLRSALQVVDADAYGCFFG